MTDSSRKTNVESGSTHYHHSGSFLFESEGIMIHHLDMNGLLVFSILFVVLLGCAQGRWVKPDASPAQTQQDFGECETLSTLQPTPATLGEKLGANPDLSSRAIEKCMSRKGYQWVTEKTPPQQQEILEIIDSESPVTK